MAKKVTNIELDEETTKKQLGHMAVDHDQSLKGFIEQQLESMGDKGLSYLDLWQRCERMKEQLKGLSK